MEPLQLFGRLLRALRDERSWTQETLAEAAGLHGNYTSRLETGDQEPGLFVILKLCRAFDVTLARLLADFTTGTLRELRLP